jgi:hypothetical protein
MAVEPAEAKHSKANIIKPKTTITLCTDLARFDPLSAWLPLMDAIRDFLLDDKA